MKLKHSMDYNHTLLNLIGDPELGLWKGRPNRNLHDFAQTASGNLMLNDEDSVSVKVICYKDHHASKCLDVVPTLQS